MAGGEEFFEFFPGSLPAAWPFGDEEGSGRGRPRDIEVDTSLGGPDAGSASGWHGPGGPGVAFEPRSKPMDRRCKHTFRPGFDDLEGRRLLSTFQAPQLVVQTSATTPEAGVSTSTRASSST